MPASIQSSPPALVGFDIFQTSANGVASPGPVLIVPLKLTLARYSRPTVSSSHQNLTR